MRSTRQLSVTLPLDMADMVRDMVASGNYATESEVIRDGLRALQARDRAMEHWLRAQVVPALDALKADPSREVSTTDMRKTLGRVHRRATKARR